MLEAALALLSEGVSAFPVRIERTERGFTKQPLCQRPMERRYAAAELRSLWPASANGIGVELGPVSNLLRLDEEGPVPWDTLGPRPTSGEFSTPSGGRGWLLQYVDGVKTDQIWKGVGHAELRLMSTGTYTVVPPSEGYTWVTQGVGKLPMWLLDRQAGMALAELTASLSCTVREPDEAELLAALKHIPADCDHHTWVKVGMALKESGYDISVWKEWSETAECSKNNVGSYSCEYKWNSFNKIGRVVRAASILHIAEQYGFVRSDKHEPLTDVGNATMLSRVGEGKICHSSEWDWLAWDGRRWQRDGDAEKVVQELQKDVLRIRLDAAVQSLAKHLRSDRDAADYSAKLKRKQRTIAVIRSHEDNSAVFGARKLAESIRSLSADYRLFDQHPYLLNCLNGTLDLQTCELRAHEPSDQLTQLCPFEYDATAACPRWESFMVEVLCDPQLVLWMQKFLGYCITGLSTRHLLPLWIGSGRNGKSTIVDVMLHVLGDDYAATAPQDFLKTAQQPRHPTEIADLYGKRFVADLETDANMFLNESRVKRLTGGDRLKGRRMGKDFFEFAQTHKLVIASNNEPNVRFMDLALQARIKKVPFNVSFKGREDFHLKEKLLTEARGILAWLVRGYKLFESEGLEDPECIRAATDEYQREQDTVKQFVDQMLVKEGKTRVNVIVVAYRAWCTQNSVAKPVDGKPFWNALREQGISKDKNDAACSVRHG